MCGRRGRLFALVALVLVAASCTWPPPPSCLGTPGNSYQWGSTPADLREEQLVDDACTPIFEEKTVTLASSMTVKDPAAAELVGGPTVTVPAGTSVTSYLVHADNVGSANTIVYTGQVSPPCTVLGALTGSTALDTSQALFAVPELTYPSSWLNHGLETVNDSVSVDADLHTIHTSMQVTPDMDHFRIICAA